MTTTDKASSRGQSGARSGEDPSRIDLGPAKYELGRKFNVIVATAKSWEDVAERAAALFASQTNAPSPDAATVIRDIAAGLQNGTIRRPIGHDPSTYDRMAAEVAGHRARVLARYFSCHGADFADRHQAERYLAYILDGDGTPVAAPSGAAIETTGLNWADATAVQGRFQRLLVAFHDATRRPLGVTPASGDEFYDFRLAEAAEERRPRYDSDEERQERPEARLVRVERALDEALRLGAEKATALAGISADLAAVKAERDDLLRHRAASEAPGWTYQGPYTEGAHLSDAVVAGRVRMLMRNDIDHEAVCCMARDGIRDLSREVTRQRGLLGSSLPEGDALRILVEVGPTESACRIVVPDGMTFDEASKRVEAAKRAIGAELSEKDRCPFATTTEPI